MREASANFIHPIFKPEEEKKKKPEKPDPDGAGFDTHQPSRLLQKPTPSLRSWVPTLSSLPDPAWSPSELSPASPPLTLPAWESILCILSTLSQASASGSGSAHSPLLRKSPMSIFLQLPRPFSLAVLATPTPTYWGLFGFFSAREAAQTKGPSDQHVTKSVDIFQGLDTAVPSSPLAVVYTCFS